MRKKIVWLALIPAFAFISYLPAAESKPSYSSRSADCSVDEYYRLGMKAMQKNDWKTALQQFQALLTFYPSSSLAGEALFFSGICNFNLGEYEQADQHFSTYLKEQALPKHFEEVFQFKLAIADKFRLGAKKHLFGHQKLPCWISAEDEAVALYDEVASTLPNDDLAVKALFGKGLILSQMKEYRTSTETFQSVIRRFPKNPLAANSYIAIGYNYFKENECQPSNADLLALAQINKRRFIQDFPGDHRVAEINKLYAQMEERYALGLFELGQYYERIGQPNAARLYYGKTAREFPTTAAARASKGKLAAIPQPQDKK